MDSNGEGTTVDMVNANGEQETHEVTPPAQVRSWSRLWPLFHPGKQVMVKAGLVPRRTSLYCSAFTVVNVLGHYTFIFSEEQRWSARCMKRWFNVVFLTTVCS